MEIPFRALRHAEAALQDQAADAGGHRLLGWLGWAGPMTDARRLDRLALLRVAQLCGRVFGLEMPSIPGLCTIGAEALPESVGGEAGQPPLAASGVGQHPGEAFARCLGEAAERLAQVETAADRAAHGEGVMALAAWPEGAAQAWPAELLLRRPAGDRHAPPPAPLSIGCAAGPCEAEARLGALLEVIERDAVALWWRGGLAPGALAADHPAARAAGRLLGELGYPLARRQVQMLALTSELGVPVVAALAFGPDGGGFCCGTACRPDWASAGRAAALELCQNELAVALAHAKRAGGEAVPGPRDQAHLVRHETVRAADCLEGLAPASAGAPMLPTGDAATLFGAVAGRMRALGFPVLLHSHERDWLGMAVTRVIVPGLACEPSSETPARLLAAQRRSAASGNVNLWAKYRLSLFS